LGNVTGDAGFSAVQDFRAVEVSAIGNGCEFLRPQNSFCLLGHVRQLRAIRAAVRHLMGDNQVMLGVHRDLHIVANNA
jgi:hypothetical protein